MQRSKCNYRIVILAVTVLLSVASCDHDQNHKKGRKHQDQSRSEYARDWNRFPAIVERNTRTEIIALGDVHGGYERLVSLLSRAGLIKPDRQSPGGYSWSGSNRLLVS